MAKDKTIKIKGHFRKVKGKRFKVKPHKRKMRGLGKRLRFTDIGRFQVAHDELGNFRGSRVVKGKKRKPVSKKPVKKIKKTRKVKRSRVPIRKLRRALKVRRAGISSYPDLQTLDTDFIFGNITPETWKREARLLGRP